jgi:hypothetical protein
MNKNENIIYSYINDKCNTINDYNYIRLNCCNAEKLIRNFFK